MKVLKVVGAMALVEGALLLLDRTFQTNCDGVQAMSLFFGPDSKLLYGGGSDSSLLNQKHNWLWAWSTADGRMLWKTRIPTSTYPRRLSPDGASLLVEPPNLRIALWDTDMGRPRFTLETGPPQESRGEVRFTPDSKRILGCYRDGVQVWNAYTGRATAFWRVPHTAYGRPNSLHFTPDGSKLLVGFSGVGKDASRPVQLWDTRNGRVLQSFEEREAPCALSPSGNRIALVRKVRKKTARQLVIQDLRTGALLARSKEFSLRYRLDLLRFASDDSLLCYAIYEKPEGGFNYPRFLWDIPRNQVVEHVIPINEFLSPDKRLKAIANRGGYRNRPPLVTLYDVATNIKLRDLEGLAGC